MKSLENKVVVVVCLFIIVGQVNADIERYVIAASFGLTPDNSREIAANRTLTLWMENYVRPNEPFVTQDGRYYTFDIRIMDHGNDTKKAMQNYRLLIQDAEVSCFFLPFFSSLATAVANEILVPNKRIMMSVPTPPTLLGLPNAFLLAPKTEKLIETSLYALRFAGGDRVAVLQSTEPDSSLLCGPLLTKVLNQLGVSKTQHLIFDVQGETVPSENVLNLSYAIRTLKEARDQFDAVVVCAFTPTSYYVMDSFVTYSNWFPPALIMLPQIFEPTYLFNAKNAAFTSGPIIWADTLPYPGDRVFGTPSEFSQAYKTRFSISPIGASAGTASALVIFEEALIRTFKDAPGRALESSISFALSRIDIESVFGRMRFGTDGANLVDPPFLQYMPDYSTSIDNLTFSKHAREYDFIPDQVASNRVWEFSSLTTRVIFPPLIQQNRMVYPIPDEPDRYEDDSWFQYTSEIVVISFDGIGLAISLFWIFFVFVNRKTDAIRYASPFFLYLMLFGSILMYLAVFCWMMYVTDASCQAMPWLLMFGFCIFLGSVLIKIFRIWKITSAADSFTEYNLPLWLASSYWILVMVPPAILLIVWQSVSPMYAEIHVPDPIQPSSIYYTCSVSSDGTIFIGLLGGYCLCLFAAALFFVVKTWKIDRTVLNESIWLAFSVWTLLLCSIIAVVVVATGAVEREVEFVIRSMALILGVCFATCVFYVPKVFYIAQGKCIRSSSSNSGISA